MFNYALIATEKEEQEESEKILLATFLIYTAQYTTQIRRHLVCLLKTFFFYEPAGFIYAMREERDITHLVS